MLLPNQFEALVNLIDGLIVVREMNPSQVFRYLEENNYKRNTIFEAYNKAVKKVNKRHNRNGFVFLFVGFLLTSFVVQQIISNKRYFIKLLVFGVGMMFFSSKFFGEKYDTLEEKKWLTKKP